MNATDHVAAIRNFNRFYTRQIGLVSDGYLQSRYPLVEARVLYELATRKVTLASDIGTALSLDAGYLSRILGRFVRRGWLTRSRSATDARKTHLALTARGFEVFANLDKKAHHQMSQLLSPLNATEQARLNASLAEARHLLNRGVAAERSEVTLRDLGPGDIGWIIQRHGVLYTQEYGWTREFETLVAEICLKFMKHHDAARERCWIAEHNGAPVGMVMLVQDSATVARLRLMLVEPSARGLGVGRRLVDACLAFARENGYSSVKLWTQSILVAARKLYASAGFRLIETKPHQSFGAKLQGETWELSLSASSTSDHTAASRRKRSRR